MVSDKQKRLRKKKVRKKYLAEQKPKASKKKRTGLDKIYHDNYKQLFAITTIMLILSLGVISWTYFQTGDIFYKGVSLSGGITITIPTGDRGEVPPAEIESLLISSHPTADFAVREISELGVQSALSIEASIQGGDLGEFEGEIMDAIVQRIPYAKESSSIEVVGPSLGQSFFAQVTKAVLIALVFMGLVVFWYFGDTRNQKIIVTIISIIEAMFIWNATGSIVLQIASVLGAAVLIWYYVKHSIPSAAVILAAISTIIFTIAVVDLMGMRISTAGVAAFLMLIGYSVDTDILLSTRVLKRSSGSVYDRCLSTVKTGLTMECTTLIAAGVALIFSQSAVIKEIMTIIFIGLVADIFFTWIQNVGILRWYLERKHSK